MILARFALILQGLLSVLSFDVSVPTDVATTAPAAPCFVGPIQNVTVAVGREAVLTCVVDDLGQYKVGWMRADDQTILSLHTRVITQNARVSVANGDGSRVWQLRIRQLRETDRGCYMCQINTSAMKKQLGCIDVQVPPDIDDSATSSDVTVPEGDNATLSCTARGRPHPRILWRRENGDKLLLNHQRPHDADRVDTFGGPTLSFLRVDRRQMGAYLCIASNDVPPAVSKRILLHINFAPAMKVPDQLVGAPLNTQVVLRCLVEAYPSTINYWTRSLAGAGSEIIMNSKKHGVAEDRQAYKTHMTLTVRNLLKRDLGSYVCVATNSLGRVNGSIRVYEIQLPTRQPPAVRPTSRPDKTAGGTRPDALSSSTSWGAVADPGPARVTTEVYMPVIREASVVLGSAGTSARFRRQIILVLTSAAVLFCR